ncbi:uncharacterized protein LOC121938012 [Plectropomus leopardus]|uniref:uncharacterized protein LOC121938012 n=1 Tax=Plectropomus leopardus TaxID=160734 RepID=UPI001C4CE99F|nr:uncharacterized protein LOC121938012 [Plectropomus leopardus]
MKNRGSRTRWEGVRERALTWQDIWSMEGHRIKLLLCSVSDVLPSPSNLHTRGWTESPGRMPSGKPADPSSSSHLSSLKKYQALVLESQQNGLEPPCRSRPQGLRRAVALENTGTAGDRRCGQEAAGKQHHQAGGGSVRLDLDSAGGEAAEPTCPRTNGTELGGGQRGSTRDAGSAVKPSRCVTGLICRNIKNREGAHLMTCCRH